ncbi:MAG TPA: mechanosensitive ion channel domain-containing protein [Bryobacteraceae bacterium]|nr:mechanosensitive ion channel domain-containing protein [Bryobacteraceae bacterium]
MIRRHTLPAAILALLLLACLLAVYATRDAPSPPSVPSAGAAAGQVAAVDTQLLETANQMAALAETSDEQQNAREALRLADHELDQAFATALRQAAAYRPPSAGPIRELADRVNQLKDQVAWDHRRVAQLTKQADPKYVDLLDLANAQLALDQDELDEAQQDLARQGGDPHSALEQARQGHAAISGQSAQALKGARPSPTGTLLEQTRAWLALGSMRRQLLDAEQRAAGQAMALTGQHNQLEKQTHPRQPDAEAETIESLGLLSDQRKTLAELDKRIQDCRQLAEVYRSWSSSIQARRKAVLHLLLISLAKILAIVLGAILLIIAIRQSFRMADRHRLYQGQVIASVAVQFIGLAFILLVIFGPPNQLSTIIGLTTAGLTVVLGNFILSFFGWFALMGKNGIRVGDWVEINGVGGEVIEIGILKTVLLESGGLTDTGHPTGRQVAFANSFAMNGHYFNFSTAGQWLWDELEVTLPPTGDAYLLAEEIRKLVERETEADFAQAAKDWERSATRYGARAFSAKPTVNLRPTGVNGVQIVVRYITHAPQRYAVKSKLFQAIVNLLHKPAENQVAPT